MNCDLIAVFASDLGACERTQRCFTLIHIGHLHIFHNTPCLPPKPDITFVFYFSWVLL